MRALCMVILFVMISGTLGAQNKLLGKCDSFTNLTQGNQTNRFHCRMPRMFLDGILSTKQTSVSRRLRHQKWEGYSGWDHYFQNLILLPRSARMQQKEFFWPVNSYWALLFKTATYFHSKIEARSWWNTSTRQIWKGIEGYRELSAGYAVTSSYGEHRRNMAQYPVYGIEVHTIGCDGCKKVHFLQSVGVSGYKYPTSIVRM